jgi:membrane fusion protein (multidrug efflux system)
MILMIFKMNSMKKVLINLLIVSAVAILAASCSGGKKEEKGAVTDLKVKLEQLKKEKVKLDAEIRKAEEAIAKADPSAKESKAFLVAVAPVTQQDFVHYVELQGRVDAENSVVVMPRGMPAQVKEVYVKKGATVNKGQLLLKLEDAVMLEQLEGLKTQLAFAENLYNRQKNLWDQGIGTEVQLISAKNNVDALNKQISTLKETWSTSFVYAPLGGVADEVNIKAGEVFNGYQNQLPQIRIINGSNMKVITDIPENYVSRIKKGSAVEIVVPDLNNTAIQSTISVIGASINPNSRGFVTESRVPSSSGLKINQVALVRIRDYSSPNAISVPVNVVQADEKGKYVYVAVKEGDMMKARKKTVNVGEAYNGMIEVKMGLTPADRVITEGYQNVYDGQTVTTNVK